MSMTLEKCWITEQSNTRIEQLAIHHYILQEYILTNIIATRHKYLSEKKSIKSCSMFQKLLDDLQEAVLGT